MAAHAANDGNPVLADLQAAQAILESGLASSKPSDLAVESKNLFGIKGKGTDGSKKYSTTEFEGSTSKKVMADFAVNKSLADSFQQHTSLIQRVYPDATKAKSFEEAARAVKRGGYASDPDYTQKLIDIYRNTILPRKRELIAEGKIDNAGHYLGSDSMFALTNPNFYDRVAYKTQDWEIFQHRDGSANGWTMTALSGVLTSLGLSFFNKDKKEEEKSWLSNMLSGATTLAIIGGTIGFFVDKFMNNGSLVTTNVAKATPPSDGTALASANKDKKPTDLASLNLPQNKGRLPSTHVDEVPSATLAMAGGKNNAGSGGLGVAPSA